MYIKIVRISNKKKGREDKSRKREEKVKEKKRRNEKWDESARQSTRLSRSVMCTHAVGVAVLNVRGV